MRLALAAFIVALAATASASDVSWIFLPGYYTHRDGVRVTQYEQPKPSYVTTDPTYQESGSRHQSYGCGGNTLDIYQTWGNPPAYYPRPYYSITNPSEHYAPAVDFPQGWRTPIQGPPNKPRNIRPDR